MSWATKPLDSLFMQFPGKGQAWEGLSKPWNGTVCLHYAEASGTCRQPTKPCVNHPHVHSTCGQAHMDLCAALCDRATPPIHMQALQKKCASGGWS